MLDILLSRIFLFNKCSKNFYEGYYLVKITDSYGKVQSQKFTKN